MDTGVSVIVAMTCTMAAGWRNGKVGAGLVYVRVEDSNHSTLVSKLQ
jgi:hypothetical protein